MKLITIKGGTNPLQMQQSITDQLKNIFQDAAQFTVNAALGAMLIGMFDFERCTRTPEEIQELDKNPNITYLIGMLDGINVMVDPNMRWTDTRAITEDTIVTIDVDANMLV